MIDRIIELFNEIAPLSTKEEMLFESVFKLVPQKQNEFFVEADSICHRVGFVHEGILRTFFYNRNGQEITKYFSRKDQFVCDFASFENLTKTSEYIQCETPCELLVCDRSGYARLAAGIRKWDYYLFKIYQKKHQFRSAERDQQIGLSQTEIYQRFVKENPDIAGGVPVGHIASYLGITPQSLSRIRRNHAAVII